MLDGSVEAANEYFVGGNLFLLNAGGSEEQFVVWNMQRTVLTVISYLKYAKNSSLSERTVETVNSCLKGVKSTDWKVETVVWKV